jgi:hypothetical protein
MTRVLNHLGALAVGASLLSLASSGCEARGCDEVEEVEYEGEGDAARQQEDGACVEFVQLKKWWGEAEVFTGTYESGKNVVVANGNGDIMITVAERDDISVRFDPFVARAFDTCNGQDDTGNGRCEEIDDNLAAQEFIFEDDDGNYIIQARREDGVASLGAEIEVQLPSSFDGRLTVDQNNGFVEVGPMGDAAAVIVGSGNGGCDVHTGAAPEIDIRCENGSTDVVIGAITEGSDLRQIYKTEDDLGDLTVQFPATDAPFSVSARSVGSDVELDPSDLSGVGCQVSGSDPRSITVGCNDATNEDPLYTVRSDQSLADITLVF